MSHLTRGSFPLIQVGEVAEAMRAVEGREVGEGETGVVAAMVAGMVLPPRAQPPLGNKPPRHKPSIKGQVKNLVET